MVMPYEMKLLIENGVAVRPIEVQSHVQKKGIEDTHF